MTLASTVPPETEDMRPLPKVSIMIPTFRHRDFIVRAIESALAQDYPNIEIVVGDDNSPDDTRKIVEEFIARIGDDRVKYFRNDENLGILKNYHKNLYENVGGDWAINLDGDDFFLDNGFISDAMALAATNPEVVLIFANYREYQQNTGRSVDIMNRDHKRIMGDEEFYRAYASNEILWNHNSIIYQRAEAIRLGFYWDPRVPRNDWESFLRLIVSHKVGYLGNIASAWVQHDSNETRRLDIKKYMNNFVLIKGICDFSRNAGMSPSFISDWYEKMVLKSTRSSCIGYIRNKDFRGMLGFLRQVFGISRTVPLRVALDPGLWGRAILAFNPSLYSAAKSIVRKTGRT